MRRSRVSGFVFLMGLAVLVPVAWAGDGSVSEDMFAVNNVWMMVCTFLVFIMHLGFASVESGLTRAKNTTNILFKNTAIVAIGILMYAFIGFNIMYPDESWVTWFGFPEGFFGWSGIGIAPQMDDKGVNTGESIAYASGNYTYWTNFLFQAMFAATGATIISGAVAERIKLSGFLVFITVFVALVYTVAGSWHWGEGWLDELGFHDFAGSTIVHSVGGWGALACVMLLGPRLGKYTGSEVRPIMGHSMPLATIGVFLLWLGWFGFNGGSVLSAHPGDTSRVLVTTNIAAAAGVMGAMMVSWVVQQKPDLSMALNGALAGLVGITASCDQVTVCGAVMIGLVAGVLVVFSVIAFDKIRIDDPVGAISVHLTCGVWGTLAAGLFAAEEIIAGPAAVAEAVAKVADKVKGAELIANTGLFYGGGIDQLRTQIIGVVAVGVFVFVTSLVLFGIVKATIGVRVSEQEELRGLDISEHGMEAYSGFQFFTTQ